MNDTITRLMALADQFAGAYRIYGPQDAPVINARQALQDELQKLFTPLSNDEVSRIAGGECWAEDGIDPQLFAKEIEAAHGIGGKS